MSLDHTKLEKLRPLANGVWQAQCPACAESGQDRKGEHLRISPDGKFGCCVYPGDSQHRKRIFALAGSHGPKAIKVRVAPVKTASSVQLDLLGRLGRAFGPNSQLSTLNSQLSGTLRTPFSDPRAYANETMKDDLFIRKLIGSREPVLSVLEIEGDGKDGMDGTDGSNRTPGTAQLPYLLADGTLVIPFDSPERYHWWKGGQSVRRTVAELVGKGSPQPSTT
jgi:hypothetical protein